MGSVTLSCLGTEAFDPDYCLASHPIGCSELLCSDSFLDKLSTLSGGLCKTCDLRKGGTFHLAEQFFKFKQETTKELREVPKTLKIPKAPPSPRLDKQQEPLRVTQTS